MKESKLQAEVIKYLKHKGCYVIKTQPGMGTPTGCPDIIALIEGAWIAIEVKAECNSPFQPLQKETIEKLSQWSYAKVVHSKNWPEIKKELEEFIG
jgi:Holliday junction resolvase